MTDQAKSSRNAPEEVEYLSGPGDCDCGGKAEEGQAPAATAPEVVRALRERLRKRSAELRTLRREAAAEMEKLRAENAEVAKLRDENAELRDQYLRKLADADNLRKRFEREKAEHYQYALSELLLELLDVLDNFERALETAGPAGEGDSHRAGVELIYRMFQTLLLRKGVRPIEDVRTFDPAIHHAMTTEESDEVTEPQVAEVLQKGYMLHNRLLRPALVKVLVPRKTGER